MQLKPGVIPTAIRPELLLSLIVADGIWSRHGQELVVTSMNDSRHSRTSLHYSGQAADLRIWGFDDQQKQLVAADLRQALGDSSDYDVVVEATHIHLEYQPKSRLSA